MRSALRLTGLASVQKQLRQARARAQVLMREAMGEALILLEDKAQGILDGEIYQKARAPYAEQPTYELYHAFVQKVARTGLGLEGELSNTSPHAGFLEFGTDDEGTGKHLIPLVVAKALHWVNAETGEDMFAAGGVMVQGIKPIHFMERALTENRSEVIAIFQAKLSTLFE